MTRIVASAPGKVVLAGEYAVLSGAPAISIAVDRRALVVVDAGGNGSVSSSGVVSEPDPRIVDCVRAALAERTGSGDAGTGRMALDTSAFVDPASGSKLGIGSSAALTAALVVALSPAASAGPDVFRAALAAHRAFQGGRGSGVDVATSVAGGVVEYRVGEPPLPHSWPKQVELRLYWSGVAASTAMALERYDPAAVSASADALRDAARVVAERFTAGAAGGVLDAVAAFTGKLEAFDIDHRLGIFDAGHARMLSAAREAGLVYKPCGAGGGDVGAVLGIDAAAVDAFDDTARALGFEKLDMAIDEHGARRDDVRDG